MGQFNPSFMSSHRPNLKPDTLRTARVLVMALSAFIFNTTEFIPVALLSDIGASFAMPSHEVGMMMTVYAWIVALLSLPAMLITANIERKTLLLWLFAIFILSHIVTVMAFSFNMLLVSRAGVALSHAVFWSITASLVVRLAPKGKQTWALGLLATGSALATVLGLPLGRILGQLLGWRATFLVIMILACICMLILWQLLPKLPSRNAGTLKSLPDVFNNKPLIIIYLLTALLITAHFSAYSYIEPFMQNLGQFNQNFTTIILLIFGVAGMIASFIFGRFYERMQHYFLPIFICMIMMTLSLAYWAVFDISIWIILSLFWGISITAISLVLQIRTLKLSPKSTDVAMSLFSGIYNIGIGGGALLGSVVIAQMGLYLIGYAGAIIALLALIIFIRYRKIL